jgi:hypothetical protein
MARLRAIPWFVLMQALVALRDQWSRLPQHDRARLTEIIRDARATRSLSPRDREDLARIARSIDKTALGRAVVDARERATRGGRHGIGPF